MESLPKDPANIPGYPEGRIFLDNLIFSGHSLT